MKNKNTFIRLLISVLAIIFLISSTRKNLRITTVNPVKIIADHQIYLKRKPNTNHKLITNNKDALRIWFASRKLADIQCYYNSPSNEDISSFIKKYNTVNYPALFDIIRNKHESPLINISPENAQYKRVLSFFGGNKHKKHYIYLIESKGELLYLSNTVEIIPESGILENGDIEIIDDTNESYKKNTRHIQNYSLYFDSSEKKHTPQGAYFYNNTNATKMLPYYSCSDNLSISGKYSVQIKFAAREHYGYILFSQKFSNGKYILSVIIKGTKNTEVDLIQDCILQSSITPKPLCSFTIPNSNIYKIIIPFEINILNKDEYFIVGARVRNGEAMLDNFVLRKCSSPLQED